MYIKITLNGESLSFIISRLKSFTNKGKVLMSKIIDKIYLTKFEVWGFFPIGIIEKDLKDCESGGKFEKKPLTEISLFVQDLLKNDPGKCWLLIDNTKSTEYIYTDSLTHDVTHHFSYDNLFLHLYHKTVADVEEIKTTFSTTGAYPFLGIITDITDEITDKIYLNSLDEIGMDALINNTAYLIVGAYDEEGYLIVEFE